MSLLLDLGLEEAELLKFDALSSKLIFSLLEALFSLSSLTSAGAFLLIGTCELTLVNTFWIHMFELTLNTDVMKENIIAYFAQYCDKKGEL